MRIRPRVHAPCAVLCAALAGAALALPQLSSAVAAPKAGEDAVTLVGPQSTRYLPERGGDGDGEQSRFGFAIGAGEGKGKQRVSVRIDTGKLSRVADVGELGKDCRAEGGAKQAVTCSYSVGASARAVNPFELSAARGSEAGDKAEVTVTASAGDGKKVRRSTDVVVGVPRFTASAHFDKKRQQPGGTARLRLKVRASGEVPAANGFGIRLHSGDDVSLSATYRNCGKDVGVPSTALCTLDKAPRPGGTVSFTRPLDFHVPKHLLYTPLDVDAYAIGGPDDPGLDPDGEFVRNSKRYDNWREGRPGDPALETEPDAEGAEKGGRFEKSPRDWIKVDSHVDVSVAHRTLRAKEGETIGVPIRTRERWPDGSTESPNYMAYTYRFTAPEGTKVVGVPEDSGEPMCETHGRTVSCPGGLDGESLSLRVDRKVPGAHAKAAVRHSAEFPAHDPGRANDSATMPLKVSGVTSQLRTSRAVSAALPWGAGVAGVLAAGVAYWLVRRRKARAATGF
ncbi:hypothetical protein OHB04_06700 [Streptomyces sp. NBC_01775]|uniref:hypothetical protein n=1 Tax=Streptomyces sp. NBC_01775 TaxID=2975939 RepID=UPI002DD8B558|nr:hypothetical protein [Streptomyces sp. NBC_01775]WSB75503.1 hypothetical protein OHB04_06700 [Streptomyces sp. NBC_01775]